MSETLTNGVIVPDKGSRDWYADLRSNWLKLDSLMAGGNITINPAQTNGILVATITVGGKEYKLYQQDGDVSVKIDPSTENAEYPLVASTSAEANTGSVVMAPAVTVNPSTGAVTATSFKGKLEGNASTATTATKAVQDGTGAVIADTYATKSELNTKANDSNVVHKSGDETVNGTKTFSSQIKGSVSGTSSDVVVGSDTATTRGYLVNGNLPWYKWEEGSQVIAGKVPLITDFNNLTKPGVYHVVFCLNDGFVQQENEYKESLNRPSIPGSTTGFMDAILEIKQTSTMHTISGANRLIQKLTLLSGSPRKIHTDLTYHRVCIMYSPTNVWTAWKTVARDEEVVHKSGAETIVGTKTFSDEVQVNMIKAVGGGGANITLTPPDNGGFAIRAFNGTVNKELVGYPSGMLAWDNNEILTRVNGVTLGTAQTITGEKTFRKTVYVGSLTSIPANNLWIYVGDINATYGRINMRIDGTITIDCVNVTTKKSSQMNLKPDGLLEWNSSQILLDTNQIMLAKNLTGANITPGGIVDCGNGNGKLKQWHLNADGTFLLANTLPTGIWKSTSSVTLAPNEGGIFIKLS